uniref:Uncharacterized protein n=1 Tax=Arundo donax TaxID=35708 RepID=A0A0A8YIR6_ARUDO
MHHLRPGPHLRLQSAQQPALPHRARRHEGPRNLSRLSAPGRHEPPIRPLLRTRVD